MVDDEAKVVADVLVQDELEEESGLLVCLQNPL